MGGEGGRWGGGISSSESFAGVLDIRGVKNLRNYANKTTTTNHFCRRRNNSHYHSPNSQNR